MEHQTCLVDNMCLIVSMLHGALVPLMILYNLNLGPDTTLCMMTLTEFEAILISLPIYQNIVVVDLFMKSDWQLYT